MPYMSTPLKNCMLCSHFERISSSNSVLCNDRHVRGHSSPARETQCVFFEREPGADDETDLALWRQVMHRAFPPKPDVPLVPRARPAPQFDRAVMADYYAHQDNRGRT